MFIYTSSAVFLAVASDGMSKQIQAIIAQQAAGVIPTLTPALSAPVGVPLVPLAGVSHPPNTQLAAHHLQLMNQAATQQSQQHLYTQNLTGAPWLKQAPPSALTAASAGLSASAANLRMLPAVGVMPPVPSAVMSSLSLDLNSPPPVTSVKSVPSLMSLPLTGGTSAASSINMHR